MSQERDRQIGRQTETDRQRMKARLQREITGSSCTRE